MENEKFNAIVKELIARKMAKGLSLEAAVAELVEETKAALLESGLYEELKAKAAPMAVKPSNDRDDTIFVIRASLKARGLSYSVTGGRGTSWGWITIDLKPAAYKTFKNEPETIRAMIADMNERFGLARCGSSISIPASRDYYQEYIDRAAGIAPRVIGKPYWD